MCEYNFKTLSDEALDRITVEVQQERNRRANIRKAKLIDDFSKAFYALRDAGYDISFDGIYISNVDSFEIS